MMKMKPFIPVFLAISIVACDRTDRGGSKVNLQIEGAGGSTAYFDRFANGQAYHVDSVKLDSDGGGTISLPPLPLDLYRISIRNNDVIVAIDSTENLTLHAHIDSLDLPRQVEGSKHTELMVGFNADQRAYELERDQLRKRLANSPGDTAAIQRFNRMNSDHYEEVKAFIQANSASPVALTAVNQFDLQREFDLYKKVREDLRKPMQRSGFYDRYRQRVDQHEQQLIAIRMQEEEMKRQEGMLPIGSEAPDIRQQTPEGGTFALSQLRGKVVLIDFWASWCRPCRIENPAVKKVYDKYKGKGFEILGVSLDKSHEAWVGAIQQDGLPWKHVSDLGFWQNAAAQEYGVNSIPFTVLVDPDGKVIDKGLRAHQLDMRLAELFGS